MEGNFKNFTLILESLTSYTASTDMGILTDTEDKTVLKNNDGKI